MDAPQPLENRAAVAPALQGNESLDSLPALRKKIREHVDAEIRLLPAEETVAYREAVQKCPDLVQTETDPLQFVRFCGYNVWRAANRLCLYWTERKNLFKERAFLPLILTGFGALQEQEIMLLQAGYPAILPDTASGQKVLFFDRRKLVPGTTSEHRLKAIFYIMAYLAQEDSATQTEGIMVLSVLCTPRLFDNDPDHNRRAIHIGANVFPCRFHLHFISIPHQKKPYLVQDFVIKVVVPCMEALTSVEVHIEEEKGDLCEKLEALGLRKDGIPMAVGGGALWRFEECFRWVRQRKEIERERHRGLMQYSALARASGRGGSASNDIAIAEDTGANRRRMADMLHSRRKRERRKNHVLSLKENSQALSEENRALVSENERLQGLLERAQQLVANIEGTSGEYEDRKRKAHPS